MIVSSDPDYIDTKLVKQGAKQIDTVFQELANWINTKFDTKVPNIYYDKIEVDKSRPRLSIIFEFFEEAEKFKDNIGNFDTIKQNLIEDKFREIVSKDRNTNSTFFARFFNKLSVKRFDTDRLFVIFTSFEPIAREEATHNIPENEVESLKKELRMEDLWKIYRQFSLTTFFFYTDKQTKEYTNEGATEFLKQKYFDLLKKYDEFDYVKKDTYFIKFDSKENFDKNYQSSWFYYSR